MSQHKLPLWPLTISRAYNYNQPPSTLLLAAIGSTAASLSGAKMPAGKLPLIVDKTWVFSRN
jgi:hypothetical protein